MALKEYKPEKLLYTMGEVTEMFDVRPSLIRFWEQRFDILKPKKNKKGNRLFTPADVKNLEIIYHLTKERGMTLAGVEKYLKNNKEDAERETEIVRRLQTIRSLLVEIREELKEDQKDEIRVFPAAPQPEPHFQPEPQSEPKPESTGTPEFEEEIVAAEEFILHDESEKPLAGLTADYVPAEVPEKESCPVRQALDDFFSTPEPIEIESEEEEEELIDVEVTVPFTAQPLFEVDEAPEIAPEELEAEAEEPATESPSAVDTQQSLF